MPIPEITISVDSASFHKSQSIYYEPALQLKQFDTYAHLTYYLNVLVRIIDQFDQQSISIVSSKFYDPCYPIVQNPLHIQPDPIVHPLSFIPVEYELTTQLHDRHIIECLPYDSIVLVRLLTNLNPVHLERWSAIALENYPSSWFSIFRLYQNLHPIYINYPRYLYYFESGKNDQLFEHYIQFMQAAQLDLPSINLDPDKCIYLADFLDISTQNNNYKTIKHFLTEHLKQIKPTDSIYLRHEWTILYSIFTENFTLVDLLVEFYLKLPNQKYKYTTDDVSSFIATDDHVASIQSIQYFHSISDIIEFDMLGDSKNLITEFIIEASSDDRAKPQFAYLITAFPLEALDAKDEIESQFHLDLIDEATRLE